LFTTTFLQLSQFAALFQVSSSYTRQGIACALGLLIQWQMQQQLPAL
jgi:hypothetical protein